MKILSTIRQNRVVTSLIASLGLAGFYFFQIVGSWPGLRSSGVRGPRDFIDQESILYSANCFKQLGRSVYSLDVDPSTCGGFQYSIELLRFLNFSRLSSLSSYTIGTAFIWSTIAIFSFFLYLIRRKGKADNFVAILALTSPGIWLLFERGNYDALIYILIIAGLILLKSKFHELGILLIGVTVLMKFYTLPLYFLSILLLKRKTSRRIASILAIPLTVYILILIKQVALFPSTWYVSFGFKSLGLYFQLVIQEKFLSSYQINLATSLLFGLAFLGLLLMLLIRLEVRPSFLAKTHPSDEWARGIYFGMLVVFLSCFFAGMNFDYRLIYPATLIAISPLVLSNNRFRSIMVISGLAAILLSTYSFGLHGIPALMIQFAGDCFLYLFSATQVLLIYYYVHPVLLEMQKEFLSLGFVEAITLLRSKF